MFSLTLSRPLIISLAVVSTIGIVSAAFFQFSGTAGTSHSPGIFSSDGITGNAGTISFDPALTALCGGSTAGLEGVDLKGYFCLQTLGKATFINATIIPSPSRRATDLWTVVGTANSSGGLIYFQSGSYHTYYDPDGRRLVGEGWNYGVGRVPFGVAVITDPSSGFAIIDPAAPTSATTITSTAGIGFEGRVKVLGNIGGNSAFNSLNALGSSFNASLMNDTLQKVRKNVALLTRNVSDTLSNPLFDGTTRNTVGNKLFYINKTTTLKTLTYSNISTEFPTSNTDSLILIGGDLIINTDLDYADTKAKGIIVLKNDAGVGGNIFVTNSVKNIDSSMFLEGSLYSGIDKDNLYNGTTEGVLTLGNNQLYIRGSLISRNTIGGSFVRPDPKCVYGETVATCTAERSIQYDLNYFRQTPPNRDPVPPAQSTRSYGDSSLDSYSLIIELDPRLATTPPPGF